jgi:hypothetical protein
MATAVAKNSRNPKRATWPPDPEPERGRWQTWGKPACGISGGAGAGAIGGVQAAGQLGWIIPATLTTPVHISTGGVLLIVGATVLGAAGAAAYFIE